MADINSPRQMRADVAALIAGIEALNAATTPGEEAEARLILDVEMALQWAAIRERVRARLLDRLRRGEL
jgi:hypothetical protein